MYNLQIKTKLLYYIGILYDLGQWPQILTRPYQRQILEFFLVFDVTKVVKHIEEAAFISRIYLHIYRTVKFCFLSFLERGVRAQGQLCLLAQQWWLGDAGA